MAYLDIWDIISDRGFWDGEGSGEEVNGRLGFIRLLEGLEGGAEELLREPLGGRAPTEAGDKNDEEEMNLAGHIGGTGEVSPHISTRLLQAHLYPDVPLNTGPPTIITAAHPSPSSYYSLGSPGNGRSQV